MITATDPMAHAVTIIHGIPSRPRVLVAEDQEDVIAALRLLLKNNGYEVDFVKSPSEALIALARGGFDAVLLDLNYSRDTTSGTEGLELLSRVQALDDTLAVVAMTAWGSVELAVKAMHRGACDFVQKPWDNEHLLQVLEQQLIRARALRQKRLADHLEQQEAANIQRALMPGEIAAYDGLTIAAFSQSARTVGGDYYDVLRLDENRSALCIADVVGKGMAAALLMSNLQAAVRMISAGAAEPASVCERLNRVVFANNVPGKFITFFYCVIDPVSQVLTYTNAGHNWPLLARVDGSCSRLTTDDLVLGATREWKYRQNQEQLRPGDRLVLFTDGITESANAEGLEFGEDELCRMVCDNVHRSASELKTSVLEVLRSHHSGELADDSTLIVAALD
ncbi:MAG TPA: SpoIIE family protein phosphatase [Candidatus Angelobacter sp.]|jgi:sigma-B regulation protein RsbU (phosphoserine phosphatase)|nr:SpoIIE family protein phosphatase [Candidatus Angelobacter sp.]